MSITIRPMTSADARIFLDIHRAAVHNVPRDVYGELLIAEWAPLPITADAIAKVEANAENEYRLIAEWKGQPAGIGSLVAAKNELRACYVAPRAGRYGVGTAIVRGLEAAAIDFGLDYLELDASINAIPFYQECGYGLMRLGLHTLGSGRQMACGQMRKVLG